MLEALSSALVMACFAAVVLATETAVLHCPQHASRDQCHEVSQNRFRFINDTTVEFSFEVQHSIQLKCYTSQLYGISSALVITPIYDGQKILDLGKVSQYLPRFQPALSVHNVTVTGCLPTNYTALFDTLNVQLVSSFDLKDNTVQDKPVTSDLPSFCQLTLQGVYGDLHGNTLPALLESLTVEDTSLLENTILEDLPLTLTELRLKSVLIRRVPAAVLNLPALRSLYVMPGTHWLPWFGGAVTLERNNASKLQHLDMYGADGALLSEWAPPVLEEVTLGGWMAERPAPVPACDKLVKIKLYRPRVSVFPTGWVASCPHLKELYIVSSFYAGYRPELAGFLENATHLTNFTLSGTELSSLPEQLFANTPNLAYLELMNNQLTQLPPQLFANTPHLTYLDLSYNQLTQLPPQIFANTPNLAHLNLWMNKLTQVPSSMMKLPLVSLDLRFNLLDESVMRARSAEELAQLHQGDDS